MLNNMSTTEQRTNLASDLRVSVARLARRLRTARADHGLTLGQISMLVTLEKHGAMTAGELAAHEGIRPPSVTRTLATLDEVGLIARSVGDADRRQSVITITPAAEALLYEDRRRRDALLADLLEGLSPEQRQVLADAAPLLDHLAGSDLA
jgi:hypothetical protein